MSELAMTRISELHKRWLKDPDYRKSYNALEGQFAAARKLGNHCMTQQSQPARDSTRRGGPKDS